VKAYIFNKKFTQEDMSSFSSLKLIHSLKISAEAVYDHFINAAKACDPSGFYAPINVMSYYHRYGLKWGFASLFSTYWGSKSLHFPIRLPVTKPGGYHTIEIYAS